MNTLFVNFSPLEVNNGKSTKVKSDDGSESSVLIKSLTPESGSGRTYLINYDGKESGGYVDLSTMKGFIV